MAPIVVEQLDKFYDDDLVEVLIYKGLAFRSMHSHGRALNGLRPRCRRRRAYDVRDGELVAGVVLGYNFGDGHFHDEGLLDAVQERCGFGRASCGWSCSSPSPPTTAGSATGSTTPPTAWSRRARSRSPT